MGGAVKAHRQIEHMLEIEPHGGEPPAMREPVGVKPDEDRAQDREEREADPGDDERQEIAEAGHLMCRLAGIHPVDDAAEKDGFGELRRGEAERSDHEPYAQSEFMPEQAHGAKIDAGQGHIA